MKRREFLCLSALGATSMLMGDWSSRAASGPAATRPNIILIFADDMGYGDPGCYGGKLAPTPAIDSLAASGVRFTDGYVTAPVCAPSRCGLMAGAYNQRFGMQWNQDYTSKLAYQIPATHKLLPETLKTAGYVTGHIGKWNISRPARHVFDEVYDLIDWEADYFPRQTGRYIGVDDPKHRASGKIMGIWGPERPGEEYITDRIGRHATEFVTKHKAGPNPFFLYLAFNAVHSPFHAKKEHQARYGQIRPEPLNFYAAMIASMDENIRRVLETLKKEGLEENTIVAFVSDNGPTPPLRIGWHEDWPKDLIVGSAGPLNGHKGQNYEGGIREPYILRWPGKLKAGDTYRRAVSTMDLYPTLCAAAGVPIPAGTSLDGVNLLPFLSGEKTDNPHEILFWKNGDNGAVRQGDWKLLIEASVPTPRLFNLKDDIGEKKNLAAEKPDLAQRLHQAWIQWSATLPEPANARAGLAPATPGPKKKGRARRMKNR